ncbi:YdeI/OmpD-associated family protein [Pseudofrankia sp. DC12]|uniref:YdeI/OmpD-associated family protein n=1 Tax=Pseudofrankia sp. DC12 TaxID=683315 RepID=UPI0005F7E885|nr:YdeI/OmpD-associated family protein [Pseudofrankia sp. DC12]
MRFRATVELHGATATGIEVPADILAGLNSGKRPKVTVTIGPHSYQTTVGSMGGRYLIPLPAEDRRAAEAAAGDEADVELVLEAAPRLVEVPADLAAAIAEVPAAQATFDGLAFTHRKEWVRSVDEAKKPETRQTRITKTVEGLSAGRRTR